MVAGRGDIEHDEFIGAFAVVARGQRRRIAGVAKIDEINAFDDALAVGIEARNDAARERHRAGSNTRGSDEVRQHAGAGGSRFLRVKLHGENIAALDDGDERLPTIAQRGGGISRVERRIGMREIKVGVAGHALQQNRIAHPPQLIPSHVRQLVGGRQRRHLPRKDSQAGFAGRFRAAGKKRLQPEADAEKRRSASDDFGDRRNQVARLQRAHQLPEVADARQDQPLGGANRFRRGRALGLDALAIERGLDRRQIAGAVFDQRNFHSSPLVLGKTRFNCGSRVAAKRNARAKALKSAST